MYYYYQDRDHRSGTGAGTGTGTDVLYSYYVLRYAWHVSAPAANGCAGI